MTKTRYKPIVVDGIQPFDKTTVAKLHGCSKALVSMILKGTRRDTIGVEQTLLNIVSSRHKMQREMQRNCQNPNMNRSKAPRRTRNEEGQLVNVA